MPRSPKRTDSASDGGPPRIAAPLGEGGVAVPGTGRVDAAEPVGTVHGGTLIESLPDAVLLHADGRILLANAAALRLCGAARPEELIGRAVRDLVPSEGAVAALAPAAAGEPGRPGRRLELVRLDGGRVPVDVRAAPVSYMGRVASLAVVRDVPERLEAERALRASEALHRVMVETGPQCVKLVAGDGTLVDMNPAGLRMIGARSLEQVRGTDILDLVAPAHRQAYRNLLRRVMAGGGGKLEFEVVGLTGARRWLETHAVPLRDADGQVSGMLGITGDITERRHAEDELRRSESRYRSLVRGALYGIYRSTPEGRLLEANPSLAAMLGYASEAELLEVDWTVAVYADPDERARLMEEYRDADRLDGVEVRWKRKDGSPVTVRLSGRMLRDPAGKLVEYEMIVEDVSARRGLEEQLRQAQKMEAIGQLAGGVAHDFNNLLTAILGSADLVLLDTPPEDPRRDDLAAIREAGERAAGLTRQLLAFSRQQVLQPRVINLQGIVAGMENLLRRIIGEDVRLETVADAGPALVNADPGQIEQVILNLVVNARDAMPDGGQLTISTAAVELDAAFVQQHPTTVPGRYVRLSVRDTGEGMDEATRRRIFEPFFTTKGPGKGTGLGLAMVYGIVKQSGGYIWVRSAPGRGATFDIYLPPVHAPAADEPVGAQPAARHAGSETILLVEDEPAVRSLARRTLDRYGYRVLEAGDGREAIEIARQHPEPVDLVLLDVVMPELGGRRAAEQLLRMWPGTKLLYMSGYPGDEERERAFEPGGFLQKPFTPDALVRRVRELLDAEGSA
jgi:two-component system, cell cycle sensor histidine kinase and response regulator CckA